MTNFNAVKMFIRHPLSAQFSAAIAPAAMLLAFSLAACSESSGVGPVQFKGKSEHAFDNVVICIAQNSNFAFPSFFPTRRNADHRTFRTYNGLIIDIKKMEKHVEVELRWDRALNAKQEKFLRFCLESKYTA